MEAVLRVLGKKDNVIHLLLLGTFAALGVRSFKQHKEIEALEAEKTSLRSANTAMASALWAWREHLFGLAEADPSASPISLARLRAIYGEDDPAAADDPGTAEAAAEESITIA
ncbi:putative UDP-glucuronosyltransferase 2B17 [Cocos nucifera]|uniref:Putative UDP-glucuronosyltransferase 2B17 n=1 Tax=Cocos nucifera TaxID=13894 RepID=A0A8K0I4K2_COCNU|nr:putative UDP-glucuronosyltransferase 2B17 [Cocos nucifera]